MGYVYGPEATNQDISARSLLPLLRKFMEGYNTTVIVFGATGKREAVGEGAGDSCSSMSACAGNPLPPPHYAASSKKWQPHGVHAPSLPRPAQLQHADSPGASLRRDFPPRRHC